MDRLYGTKKSEAKTQLWLGIALLVLGVVLIGVGVTMDGEPALLAVGVVALGVGAWSLFDGLVRHTSSD